MTKKLFLNKLSLISFFFLSLKMVTASPGDTTWVQANNIPKIDHYGNYDSKVKFPDNSKTYRKIIMVYTLGQYDPCPAGNPYYCHQWDYTVTNYVIKNKQTIEISRLITPYATTGYSRFGPTWKQHYSFDVTDFTNELQDSATIRMGYSGYSWGFSADIKFAFIEGTPIRNIIGIDKTWSQSTSFGNASNPIDSVVKVVSLTAPINTKTAEYKLTITGHGADATAACCEFTGTGVGHDYYLLLNGTQIAQHNIWRDDCGVNQLSPQGGTWVTNRGNWCPGSSVNILAHKLPNITSGQAYKLDLDFENYINTPTVNNGGYGSYSLGSYVVYYGDLNHKLDASIEEVIAPNNDENYFRENPSGKYPIIKVKNTGSIDINSIKFKYNVKDSVATEYTWSGGISPLEEQTITLNDLKTLYTMSLDSITSGLFQFEIQILSVNGTTDEDATNNSFKTKFMVAPKWPTKIVIGMKTNNQGVNGTNNGESETSWQITDMVGNVYAERKNCELNKQYYDTVSFAINAFYKFKITDLGCDGLQWWYYAQYPQFGINSGSLTIRKPKSLANIPMRGYKYTGGDRHDFGCEYSQFFTTVSNPTGFDDIRNDELKIEAYPNPAKDNLVINLSGFLKVSGELKMMDVVGRVVLSQTINSTQNSIDISKFSYGVYNVIYTNLKSESIQTRVLISN